MIGVDQLLAGLGALLFAVMVVASDRPRLPRRRGESRASARRGPRSSRSQGIAALRAFTLACDQLAVCLDAGAPPARALELVCESLGEMASSTPLPGAVRELALGAPPSQALRSRHLDGRWAIVADVLTRSEISGAACAVELRVIADQERRAARDYAHHAAARAGVQAVLPLGLCFLPAFVLLGIVPVALGLAGGLWSG